jgi:DNA-directed RNA polymerase subunit RPC12/RpoP
MQTWFHPPNDPTGRGTTVEDERQGVDREMRCSCGYRAFTSDAPALVARGITCPRCTAGLELAPLPPPLSAHRSPVVTEARRMSQPRLTANALRRGLHR